MHLPINLTKASYILPAYLTVIDDCSFSLRQSLLKTTLWEKERTANVRKRREVLYVCMPRGYGGEQD